MTIYRQIMWLVIGLSALGMIMIGSSSVVDAARDFGDQWYFIKQQGLWLLAGLASLIFFSRFDHRRLQKYSSIFFIITLGLLIAVLIPGIGTSLLGARRWINLGLFVIQPSEIAKITLIIYLSSLFVKPIKFSRLIFILICCLGLIMVEPDMGTAIVIAGMVILTYFGSGGNIAKLIFVSVLGIFVIFALILISPYRTNRVKSFINSASDPLGSSYQVRQALVALGSGGPWGLGLGQSRQKYDFLPESMTDSIFAIIGEEFGLFGTGILLAVYITLIMRGYEIAKLTSAPFSRNLAIGLTSLIGLQALINISAISSLFPLTGIPLTYISYGGSSLIIMLSASGILINIGKIYA